MFSGILNVEEIFTTAFSAYPLSCDSAAMRSPTARSVLSLDPRPITSPATSIPGINGVSGLS